MVPVPKHLIPVDEAKPKAWAERVRVAADLHPADARLDLAGIGLTTGSVTTAEPGHVGKLRVHSLGQEFVLLLNVIGNDHQVGASLGLHPQHAVNGRSDQVMDRGWLAAVLEHLDHVCR
ncbi:hypothetical protein D3C80_1604800 [compost metagenome]